MFRIGKLVESGGFDHIEILLCHVAADTSYRRVRCSNW
jgi:hypothetical protein